MALCSVCGTENPPGATTCSNCGRLFGAETAKTAVPTWFDSPSFPLNDLIRKRDDARLHGGRVARAARVSWPRLKRRELLVAVAVVSAAIVVALLVANAMERPASVEPAADYVGSDVAVHLASSERGQAVAATDPLVRRLSQKLDVLTVRCDELPQDIGDLAEGVRLDLRRRGVQESDLSILQHVAAALPSAPQRLSCASLFAAYEAQRLHG